MFIFVTILASSHSKRKTGMGKLMVREKLQINDFGALRLEKANRSEIFALYKLP